MDQAKRSKFQQRASAAKMAAREAFLQQEIQKDRKNNVTDQNKPSVSIGLGSPNQNRKQPGRRLLGIV